MRPFSIPSFRLSNSPALKKSARNIRAWLALYTATRCFDSDEP
jgi:hypothetical protein